MLGSMPPARIRGGKGAVEASSSKQLTRSPPWLEDMTNRPAPTYYQINEDLYLQLKIV